MSGIRPVRDHAGYKRAKERVEELITAEPGTAEADELEVLATLVDQWERQHFPIPEPSPIEALRFRMEQQRLQPRDLEPLIGSRARVSEVLSGKRPLSLDMIRALRDHLDIPAHVLVGVTQTSDDVGGRALAKLASWGLLRTGETAAQFVARALGPQVREAHFRKTRTERTNAKTDQAALVAWCAAAVTKAEDEALPSSKRRPRAADARQIARLSRREDGLRLVREELGGLGIVLVCLEHLPGTYLDGAALRRRSDNAPVIALTLRHDRIDNFWFTLLHEFIHVVRHLKQKRTVILDDLEVGSADQIETEADVGARDALIPPEIWAHHNSPDMQIEEAIRAAEHAEVHPAIVAGRWQREHSDYRRFAKLVGHGRVRCELLRQDLSGPGFGR